MNICGKALPPKAATLLGTNTLLLVLCVPLILTLHSTIVTSDVFPAGRFVETLIRLSAIGLLCQVVFYYFELYNLQIVRNHRERTWRVLGATGIVMLTLAAIFWIFPALSPGRDALLGLPVASIAVLFLTRRLAIVSRRTTVALIGPETSCSSLEDSIRDYPEWNLQVIATYRPNELSSLTVPGHLHRIIVCADAHLDNGGLDRLIHAKTRGVRVESAAQFYEQATGRVQLDAVNLEWFVSSNGFENNNRRKLILKRCFDLCAACILFVSMLPVMLLAAAAIALEGKGPLFYSQDRVGLHGRTFRIFKFRTMVPAPPDTTPQWTANRDKRITPLGRMMRTFRVDELPQLLNVLRGDMSLVGPRPELPHFCDLLAREIPFYHQRHTVPPGLTGWAQVRYMYSASMEESRRKLEFDLFYIKNLSIWLDLAIAFETLKVVLVGQGAK